MEGRLCLSPVVADLELALAHAVILVPPMCSRDPMHGGFSILFMHGAVSMQCSVPLPYGGRYGIDMYILGTQSHKT